MAKIQVLNPFTIDADEHSLANGFQAPDGELSLTKQDDLVTSDINYIVKQFGITHELPYGNSVPEYADYSGLPSDYHAARQFLDAADGMFMEYPAEIRARFDNDAGKMLQFVQLEENREEAIRLGFIPTDGLAPPANGGAPDTSPGAVNAGAQSST